MRYFHRTALPLDDAVAAADRFLGERMTAAERDGRRRTYRSAIGEIAFVARAEGGHYTLVTVTTDNVGESEVDKLAKRFLSELHTRAHANHRVRGAY